MPPGHNGTPDTDLPDDEPGWDGTAGDKDKGNDFDAWYDDPANGKKNPNKPGYTVPRPPVYGPPPPPDGLEANGGGDDDDDDELFF